MLKSFLESLQKCFMLLKEGCVEACPGCSHRNYSLAKSLEQKENWLKKMLSPWKDKFQEIKSLPENDRWNYRGKVCLNTAFVNGEWQFGMLKRDELINIPACPVHTKEVLRTIAILKSVLPDFDQFPMAFYYHAHAQVTLILKTKMLPCVIWLTPEVQLQLKAAGIEGLAIHLHPSAGRRLFDKYNWHQVYRRNFSFDSNGLIYGNTSFHQLISSLYHQSLDMAEAFFDNSEKKAIVDLYCGRGVSLNRWEKYKSPAIGIETSSEAVICAKINAPEAKVLLGTCERRIPQLEEWRLLQLEKRKTINFNLYTNPPRTGMEPLVSSWIINNLKPDKIAYLSCSAGTLKRDLDLLTTNGYEVESLIPFDFFPQTYHVECLVLLNKNE
jgi:tRNA/tmRNA/rRNA uracil-C5-methylase (TrmA/RlmC/RlmD family)